MIPALYTQSKENQKFKASLGYRENAKLAWVTADLSFKMEDTQIGGML